MHLIHDRRGERRTQRTIYDGAPNVSWSMGNDLRLHLEFPTGAGRTRNGRPWGSNYTLHIKAAELVAILQTLTGSRSIADHPGAMDDLHRLTYWTKA